jgi:ACR3 family arsenite transporter
MIAIPLIIQTFLIFFVAYLSSRYAKLPHNIAAPAGMIGALLHYYFLDIIISK